MTPTATPTVTPSPTPTNIPGCAPLPLPIARYGFEAGAGTAVLDDSGNSHHGSLQTGASWSADATKGAFAIALDGVNGFVRVPHSDTLNFGTSQNFALTVWAKTTAGGQLISKRATALGAYPYDLRVLPSGQVGFSRSDATVLPQVISSRTVNDGNYHFIAVVKDGLSLFIYIDGVLDTTLIDTTILPTTNNENIRFGVGDSLLPLAFTGQMDELRIYNTALCDAHIVEIMNQP